MTKVQVMASSPFEGQLNTLYRPNAAHHCMMMVEGAFGLLWDINGLMGGRGHDNGCRSV